MKDKQQKLREWILKQDYFALTPRFDGMTAWEMSGIIIKKLEEIENEIEGDDRTQDKLDLERAGDLEELAKDNFYDR